jgi:hypothetical protein
MTKSSAEPIVLKYCAFGAPLNRKACPGGWDCVDHGRFYVQDLNPDDGPVPGLSFRTFVIMCVIALIVMARSVVAAFRVLVNGFYWTIDLIDPLGLTIGPDSSATEKIVRLLPLTIFIGIPFLTLAILSWRFMRSRRSFNMMLVFLSSIVVWMSVACVLSSLFVASRLLLDNWNRSNPLDPVIGRPGQVKVSLPAVNQEELIWLVSAPIVLAAIMTFLSWRRSTSSA